MPRSRSSLGAPGGLPVALNAATRSQSCLLDGSIHPSDSGLIEEVLETFPDL